MKSLAAIALLASGALASLNCTLITTVTERYCEWEGCEEFATAVPGDIVHAGCRSDCSTLEEPWFQLYDGAFVQAGPEYLEGCHYHGTPFPVTGLPHCYEEKELPAPTNCAESSSLGLEFLIPEPTPLPPEPPAIPGIGGSGGAADCKTKRKLKGRSRIQGKKKH